MITFKCLNLAPKIQQALDIFNFTEPTEIQKKAIPVLMSSARIDFHGQAQTGTGKTFAFGIPLLHKIDPEKLATQALVVAPTRELALQIRDSISQLAQYLNIKIEAIYGGSSMEDQIRNLKRGAHIVVGTPGRLNDHLRRKTLSVAQISTLVLDEADIMLDMGFKEEVDEILNYAPKNREIWLFSATVKSGISQLMASHMKNTQSVRVSKKEMAGGTTKQYFCVVQMKSRLHALARFIESAPEFYGFVFCQTKILTGEVAEQLLLRGYKVGALHGDMSQAQRNATIKKFKNKELNILVATDVAARGIDIANLTHVINYSIPEDHESYIHRIGRTGRAGKDGVAITFIGKSELRNVQFMQKKFHIEISPIDVPSRETIIESRMVQASEYINTIFAAGSGKSDDKHLNQLIKDLSDAELKNIVTRMMHDKFLSDLDADASSFIQSSKVLMPDQLQEIFINVGSDDGVTQDDVVNYLTTTGHVTSDQIQKIRVIKRRTFIELPEVCAPKLINALRGKLLGGRKAQVRLISQDDARERFSNQRYR